MVAQVSLNEKLASALPWHYREGNLYRLKRRELLKDYAGRTTYPAYEDALSSGELLAQKQIINLTQQAAEAFIMSLAADRPRFNVSTPYLQHRAFAEKMARALNRYAEELYLEEELQEIVRDSFFCVGIAKVYQASSAAVGHEVDYRMDPGRPYLQRVCLDRFVWDTSANSPEEAAFMGDFYSMPWKEAYQSSRFTPKVRKAIKDAGPAEYAEDSDKGEDLARSQNQESVTDMIYLLDVFVRQPITIDGVRYKSRVHTYVCDRALNLELNAKPVQKIGWNGDECGPYYFLNMGPVPDHFMPSSPGQNLKLLNELVNTLYRKLEEQARLQKIITVGEPGTGDADIVRNARNGDYVELTNAAAVNQMRFDGPDQNIFGMLLNAIEQHSQAANNLRQKLGLAQSADTATQEAILAQSASSVEASHQARFAAFVSKAARGLARLIFNDAHLEIPGAYEIEGTSFPLAVDDTWLPFGEGTREGSYDFYRVTIDHNSTGYQSPARKIAFLDQQFQKVLQAAPFLAQMGMYVDAAAYFDEIATLSNNHAMRRFIKSNQPPLMPEGGSSGMSMSMGGPNGQYTHTSRSTQTPEGEAMAMFQQPQQQGAA